MYFSNYKTYEDEDLHVGLMYIAEVHSAIRFCKIPMLNGVLEDLIQSCLNPRLS